MALSLGVIRVVYAGGMGNTAGLKPFTPGDPRASELGKRGAAARKAKKEATQLVKVQDAEQGALELDRLVTRYERERLSVAAAAAVQHTIARVVAGDIPVKDATDAANLIKVLFDVARLEEGQATSHTLHASIDTAGIVSRIEQLRAELAPMPPPEIEGQ